MNEFYKEEIDKILDIEKASKAKKEFDKLIESSNHNHYVIAEAIKFRFKNNFQQIQIKELLEELDGDDEYYDLTTYYNAVLESRKVDKEKAIDGLENILHKNSEYAEKARKLYPELLYDTEDYDTVMSFYEYLKENNDVNDAALFYVSKIYYFHHDIDKAKEFAEEAVNLNPNEIKYHTFLRALYQDTKDYKNALKEVRKLQSMNINPSLRNKLDILLPVLYNEINYTGKAFEAIKANIQNGINNTNQELLYFKLAAAYGDFKTVDELTETVKRLNNFCSQYFRTLVISYQSENLCDKAIDVFNSDDVDNSVFEVKVSKANTLIQMNRISEAKKIISDLLKKSNNPQYKRSYAFCLFLEGNYDDARNIMQKIPCIDNRLDYYLRYKLGILDINMFRNIPTYVKLLNNYDFESVYRDIRNRICSDDKPCRLNKDVNVKKFAYEMRDYVNSVNPTYSFDKDTYLIDYGYNIAHVNGTPTSFFLADAIPGGELITMKPVIPSKDGLKNYQRVR
ncbi:MAG: hypothetical protein IKX00_01390 [Bacilli bacterium]|nr:hypothetical protein [Bacilli bacterium]